MNRRKGKNLSVCGFLAACSFLWLAPTMSAEENHTRALVIREIKHDVSPPLRDLDSASPVETAHQHGLSLGMITPLISTTAVIDFDGVPAAIGNLYGPPDNNGAVGPTQYVQWVNAMIGIFDKTTGVLQKKLLGNAPWKGFGSQCFPNDTQGLIVQYDKLAGRWVLTHAGINGTAYAQCVAVSTSSDALGTYNLYAFQISTSVGGPSLLPLKIKLGVWPDAYYVGTDTHPAGALACALDRKSMLAGLAATAQCFVASTKVKGLLPSDLDGARLPPSGSPNYFFGLGPLALNMWSFHVDFTTPSNSTLSAPTRIMVASYQQACPGSGGFCIPQLDTPQTVNSNSDRLMYRAAYRNFGDHESIVLNHTVNPPTQAYGGIRWYEIRSPGTTPKIRQLGTYSPDSISRWMGSIAMDKVGNIALGYSASDVTIHPAIRYTGRTPKDALGTLEPEASIIEGGGSQQAVNHAWGTFTSLTIDPTDDCTFWYTNQYYKTDDETYWDTHIGAFKFLSCM